MMLMMDLTLTDELFAHGAKPTTPRHYDPTPSSIVKSSDENSDDDIQETVRPKKKKRNDA
jgi:hypothetical protein